MKKFCKIYTKVQPKVFQKVSLSGGIIGLLGGGGGGGIVEAKTIVLDMATNWGGAYLQVQSLELLLDDVLIELTTADFTAYGGSFSPSNLGPKNIFDTNTSKTGTGSFNAWVGTTHQTLRVTCVLNELTSFNKVVINNGHESGGLTNRGAKDTIITTSLDAITSIVYNEAIANATVLYDGVLSEHPPTNTVDDQVYYPNP